jgi:hypothetical protein
MPRGAKVEVVCANKGCRVKFMARVADRKRGWGRFCSKSCKAAEQEGRTHQLANHFEHMDDDDFMGHLMESGYFGHGQE